MKLSNEELLTIIKSRLAYLESKMPMSEVAGDLLEAIISAFEEDNLRPTQLRLLSYREGNKIKIIKVLREHLGLGLAEAKKLSEELPSRRIDFPMKHGLDAFAQGLREVAAEVELVS